MNYMWLKIQVMAPPTTSRRNKEQFVQWKEPSPVVGTDKNENGRASPVGARKKKQATREKVVVPVPVEQTTSETNSLQRSEGNSEPYREMQAAPPESSPRTPPTSKFAPPNKCVPPRPTSETSYRETPEGASMYLQDQGREASPSPPRQYHDRVQLHSQEIVPGEPFDSPDDNAMQSCSGRPLGKLYIFFT